MEYNSVICDYLWNNKKWHFFQANWVYNPARYSNCAWMRISLDIGPAVYTPFSPTSHCDLKQKRSYITKSIVWVPWSVYEKWFSKFIEYTLQLRFHIFRPYCVIFIQILNWEFTNWIIQVFIPEIFVCSCSLATWCHSSSEKEVMFANGRACAYDRRVSRNWNVLCKFINWSETLICVITTS